ncbi:MAG: YdiU family protein [Burkholderiales bacterium]|nr:YdiU family protein [Burkholderiales bacterium]
MQDTLRWRHRFAELGSRFYTELPSEPLPDPHWVVVSPGCAALLGWPADWWHSPAALAAFSGGALWPGMRPLASVYSGHQFGVWAGQLGDGRALLLGEVEAPGGPLEVQLKGSGLTPYSRMGDGRAVLRSSIREFLCSEAMHALGIPTTRALCVTASALPVRRETIETAAVATRVAPSFLRFGHFEHFTHTARDVAALRALADAAIGQHFPELAGIAGEAERIAALLEEVARRTARLMAQWQNVGFCHGVMNTDNMSLLGLTIDYGPFGFMDAFDPGHVCNHTDEQGRYAYARQPSVAFWNLHALAHALLPLLAGQAGTGDGVPQEVPQDVQQMALGAIEPYKEVFADAMLGGLRAKLGFAEAREGDRELCDGLLRLMAADHTDFTITFRRLASFSSEPGAGNSAGNESVRDLFIDRAAFDAWAARYGERLRAEGRADAERAAAMQRVNPKFVLRNHLAETAIRRAREGDFSEVQRLHTLLEHPFDEQPGNEADAGFPPDWAAQLEVSCSS